MRTTLSVDEDIAQNLARLAQATQRPFKIVVNEVLRRGLADTFPSVPLFEYEPHAGNLRPGIDARHLNELAWELDEQRFIPKLASHTR